MPTLYMLIGLPGCGKSTFANAIQHDNCEIISTDMFIERYAEQHGKTYNQVFEEYYPRAQDMMNLALSTAIRAKIDVIWDQTNMTKKSRKKKLNQIPKDYNKIAVVFPPDVDLSIKRNANRERTIAEHIIVNMDEQFVMPTTDEGFDYIMEIK